MLREQIYSFISKTYVKVGLLVLAILFDTLPRWNQRPFYDKGQAISIFLWVLVGRLEKDRITNIVMEWTLILAFDNLYDEMWGNPYVFSMLEKIIASGVTLWTIYRLYALRKREI